MTADGLGPVDLASPVSHVAALLDGVAPAALSFGDLAAGYSHPIPSDLTRIKNHENLGSDAEAVAWLIGRAVSELTFAGKTSKSRRQLDAGNGTVAFADGLRIGDLTWRGKNVYAVREETEKEILRDTYHNLDKQLRPFRVSVTGARGSVREAELTLHPLAHAIPRMSEKEFAELAADVRENGVKLPITVMGSKVIDGRHRLAVAAALNKPVRTVEFTGTEDEARRHIVSLNLIRRNLTIAQRGLIVRQIFLPEAEAETAEREQAGTLAPDGARGKAAQIAAERSSGLATTRTVERMKDVDNAPQTQERIRSGEIKSATEAAREAATELGKAPVEPPRQSRSAWENLGTALGQMRYAVEALEAGDMARSEGIPAERFLLRLADIRSEADRAEKLVRP